MVLQIAKSGTALVQFKSPVLSACQPQSLNLLYFVIITGYIQTGNVFECYCNLMKEATILSVATFHQAIILVSLLAAVICVLFFYQCSSILASYINSWPMKSMWPLGENHYLKCILQYENAPDPKRTQIFY